MDASIVQVNPRKLENVWQKLLDADYFEVLIVSRCLSVPITSGTVETGKSCVTRHVGKCFITCTIMHERPCFAEDHRSA